jgi:hypothetical protein
MYPERLRVISHLSGTLVRRRTGTPQQFLQETYILVLGSSKYSHRIKYTGYRRLLECLTSFLEFLVWLVWGWCMLVLPMV